MNTNTIQIYRTVKDAPANFKSQKYFTENNLKHNGIVVAKISRGCFNYDLYDLNTAVKMTGEEISNKVSEQKSSKKTVLKEVKKDVNENKDAFVAFFNEEDVPEHLATIVELKAKGLRHNNVIKGVLRVGNSFHYLFSKDDVIKVDVAPAGAIIYKSFQQASKENKNLKGISYFHDRGIMHNGIVKGIYKSGSKYNELYDIRDTFVVDEEKNNKFLSENAKAVSTKKESTEKTKGKSSKKDELPVYTKENVPSYMKTKQEIESAGYICRGSAIGKLLTGKKKEYYLLYDSENVQLKTESYWKIQKSKMEKNPENYVVVDVETTGVGEHDEIIQLSILTLEGKVLFNSHFKPTRKVHSKATEKHGLTNDDLLDAPLWTEKWNEISKLIEGKILIGYNVKEDVRFIYQTCKKYKTYLKGKLNSLCAMKYANHICKYLESCSSLLKSANYLGAKITDEEFELRGHEALFDAYLCLYVINKDAEVFKARKKAEECFIALCKKDPKGVGKKQRYIEGSTWLYNQFNINFKDIKFTNLDTANSIINKLQKFV